MNKNNKVIIENENRAKSKDESIRDEIGLISEVLNVAVKLSFLFGSLLLFCYFISIGFAPFSGSEISGIGWIVFLVFVIGFGLLIWLGFVIIFPSLYAGLYISLNEQNKKFIQTFFYWYLGIFFIAQAFLVYDKKSSLSLSFILKIDFFIFIISIFIFFIFIISIKKTKTEAVKIKTLLELVINIILLTILCFFSFWANFLIYNKLNSVKNMILTTFIIAFFLILGNYMIFQIVTNFKTTQKGIIKYLNVFILGLMIPFVVLMFFDKLKIIPYIPIKLLNLGQVNIELKLNKNGIKSLGTEFCYSVSSKKDKFCSYLDKSATIKGFLLFRTPSEYVIRIDTKRENTNKGNGNVRKKENNKKNENKEKKVIKYSGILVVRSKFVEFPIFPDNSAKIKQHGNMTNKKTN